ncbi:cysteine proteinase [Trifolium pratense]|uniref:Cysteine proteinase n=1 Tax=Trifolium pratense TaxID=57577 RepID=A0A2K3L3N5_TRIPR|nr:cysteine proteinase [Trifolium pratense]
MDCGFILAFFLLVVVATCTEDLLVRQVVDNVEGHVEQQFNIFKSKYNKNYTTKEEHDYQFCVFKAKLEFLEERNKINKAAQKNYKFGINYFSDLTYEERGKGYARVEPDVEEILLIVFVGVLSPYVVLLLWRMMMRLFGYIVKDAAYDVQLYDEP